MKTTVCAPSFAPAFTALAGLLTALTLAGCTVIPPADPARTPPQQPEYAPPRDESGYPSPAESASGSPAESPAGYPAPATPDRGAPLTYAALRQTVTVDGPRVTPLEVLEDSRCPMNARCVWAGQVRLRARVDAGRGGGTFELTSGKPVQVADGTLELVEIRPDKIAGGPNGGMVAPSAYRFGFRFVGGY